MLGYTASNDISARTLQLATKQWSFGKGLDNSCPISRPKILDKGCLRGHIVDLFG